MHHSFKLLVFGFRNPNWLLYDPYQLKPRWQNICDIEQRFYSVYKQKPCSRWNWKWDWQPSYSYLVSLVLDVQVHTTCLYLSYIQVRYIRLHLSHYKYGTAPPLSPEIFKRPILWIMLMQDATITNSYRIHSNKDKKKDKDRDKPGFFTEVRKGERWVFLTWGSFSELTWTASSLDLDLIF